MKYVVDGDVGCGSPGDPHWHRCVIAQLQDDEIVKYVKDALGIELEGDDVRAKALEAIDGNCT